MKRRDVLKWISRGLGSLTAAVVAVPGVRYVMGTQQQTEAAESTFQRVARLSELSPGETVPVSILGQRQDGWMVEPNEVIGRVWLTRRESGTEAEASSAEVVAFSGVCPHMGCQVQMDEERGHFVCPCHRAAFDLDGKRLRDDADGAPRGMDTLECRVAQDEQTEDWWVEVKYERFEPGLTTRVPKA